MKYQNLNIQFFFAFAKSGLWADVKSTDFGIQGFTEPVDWDEVYQLAAEQSVPGLVLAGIEYSNVKPPQELLLQWIGEVQMLEQQNRAMNQFIFELIKKMSKADVYTLLVKGQGIAQCYDNSLWRSFGDIDLLLDKCCYEKAKQFLIPKASHIEHEVKNDCHLCLTIDSWIVELHGTLHTTLSRKIDRKLDELQRAVFNEGDVRIWKDGDCVVYLPGANVDVIFVFAHILQHLYQGGIGLRQICDWCRLLWVYHKEININLLESRLGEMGLMSEWKAFSAFAVEYLGMPTEALPLYSDDMKWKKKADLICKFVIEVGNMGHKRDMSYYGEKPFLIRKAISMGQRCRDLMRHTNLFPLDSIRFMPYLLYNGFLSALKGV